MKYVKEYLNEEWISTDTGIDRYADSFSQHGEMEEPSDFKEMVPPSTMKFTAEDFEEYIQGLIEEVIPQSPVLALNIFKEVIKEHPYLKKRPIGFNAVNPYEPTIHKFLQTFEKVIKGV